MSEANFAGKIIIFTDGACSGNPGKGGWGAVVTFPDGKVMELGGMAQETTNNRMEMRAAIEALKEVAGRVEDVWLYTDSTYIIRGITQWIWGWKKRGWKNAEGKDVTNQDLWAQLEKAVVSVKQHARLEWKYVRGHTGVPGNERVDKIAVDFSQGRWVNLYKGSLLKYEVAIYDLPDNSELPPMRERSEKKAAHSYLSYVNGQLERHSTWSECEARVKGRPGAKFKKAKSAADEITIIKSWGLDPNQLD